MKLSNYLVYDMTNDNICIIEKARSGDEALFSAAEHWNLTLEDVEGSEVIELDSITRHKAFALLGQKAKKFTYMLRMSAMIDPSEWDAIAEPYRNQYNCTIKADSDKEAIEVFKATYHFYGFMERHIGQPDTKTYLYKYKNGRPRGKKIGNLNFTELWEQYK